MTLDQLNSVIKEMKEEDKKREPVKQDESVSEEEKANQRYGSKVYPKRNY